VDTPGFLRFQSARQEGLMRDLVATAGSEIDAADYTLIVIDAAKRIDPDLREALAVLMQRALKAQGREELISEDESIEPNEDPNESRSKERFGIVLNKVDLVHPKSNLIDIATDMGDMAEAIIRSDFTKQKEYNKEDIEEMLEDAAPSFFYTNAKDNEGVDDIVRHLMTTATPSKQWPLAEDHVTEMSNLERVEEVIREKLYRCLHREVPHQVTQINRIFQPIKEEETGETKAIRIDQALVVRTKSHLRLVMGSRGRTLERIKESAERDLADMFGCDVLLDLRVKHTRSKQHRGVEDGGERTFHRQILS